MSGSGPAPGRGAVGDPCRIVPPGASHVEPTSLRRRASDRASRRYGKDNVLNNDLHPPRRAELDK